LCDGKHEVGTDTEERLISCWIRFDYWTAAAAAAARPKMQIIFRFELETLKELCFGLWPGSLLFCVDLSCFVWSWVFTFYFVFGFQQTV